MGYNGYRRGASPRIRKAMGTVGRVAKANARPGPCHYCGEEVPANSGQLWRNSDGSWSPVHLEAQWVGSPVSGRWTGGCPEEASLSMAAPREAPRDTRGGYLDECGSCGMASCSC